MSAIPTISDAEAQGRVREIYGEIRETLQVPLVSMFFHALGRYPGYLDLAWRQLRRNINTRYFQEVTESIRSRSAEAIAREFSLSDHLAWLRGQHYGHEDIEGIDYVLRLFHSLNPKLLVITSALRQALDEHDVGGDPQTSMDPPEREEQFNQPLELVQEQQAPPRIQAIYEDIKRTQDIPFVSYDYRALAHWPEYLEMAWSELALIVRSEPYRILCGKVNVWGTTPVRRLPFPILADRGDIRAAGLSDTEVNEVGEIIRRFQEALPGLILNISALKLSLKRS